MKETAADFLLAFASPPLRSHFSFSNQSQVHCFSSAKQSAVSWTRLRPAGLKLHHLCSKTRVEVDVFSRRSLRTVPTIRMSSGEGFDFRLQPVPIAAKFASPDYSYTSVGWFESNLFANQIQFELWTELDGLAQDVRTRVSNLDADVLNDFKEAMESHQDLLNRKAPNSETLLNTTLFPLYSGWVKILNALHPSRAPISFEAGWSCGTYTFEEMFLDVDMPELDEMDFILTDESKIPDYVVIEGESVPQYREDNYFPIASFELKGPLRRSSAMDEDNMEMAQKFVDFLQSVFDNEEEDTYAVGRVISQAVVEAMLTYSGCAVLYCHTWCRAVCISKISPEKVRVKISRAYLCNEEVSASLVALTILDHALRIVEPGGRMSKKNMKNLVKLYRAGQRIGNNLEHIAQTKDALKKVRKSGGNRQSRSHGNSLNMTTSLYASHDVGEMQMEGQPSVFGDGFRKGRGGVLTKRKIEKVHWVEDLEEDIIKSRIPLVHLGSAGWSSHVFWEKLLSAIERWENPQVVDEILRTAARLLGKGGSGLVKKGYYKNSEVAVKFWNREDPEQKPLLRNEAAVYSFLGTYHPGVMGRAVPRLIATANHWWHGTVVAIEKVGRSVVVTKEGSLQVGEVTVTENDKYEIYRLAENSLRSLHSCGLCHGDINPRNLRVERRAAHNEVPNVKWNLWWIDLGTSYFTKNLGHMERELLRLQEVMQVEL